MTDAPELLPDEVNVCVNWEETRKYFSKDTVAALLAEERRRAFGRVVSILQEQVESVEFTRSMTSPHKICTRLALEYGAAVLRGRIIAIRALMEKEQGE